MSRFRWFVAVLALLSCLLAATPARAADELTPIMPLKDVRVGMKGYGLSVFHGTKIEPFPVEVISVQHDFGPQRGVIWIRCPDERMQQSGPVQGMSGSPIYLWGPYDKQKLGEGGLLIGAFALGYSLSEDCLVGVQPIELMREAGGRVDAVEQKLEDEKREKEGKKAARGTGRNETLPALIEAARSMGYGDALLAEARMMRDIITPETKKGRGAVTVEQPDHDRPVRFAGPDGVTGGDVVPLSVPLSVKGQAEVALLSPLLKGTNLRPVSGVGASAGIAPEGVDIKSAKLEPGGVLAVPLAWGDSDLSGSGTVTDVLPNGTVLGFGHAMFGTGDTQVPMATGFVHFVLPSIQTSFKIGGSGVVKGALLRDENSAVAGRPDIEIKTADVKVDVNMPRQGKRTYNYTCAYHQRLTPILAAVTAMRSVEAQQDLPERNTLRLKATMKFEGDRELHIDQVFTDAASFNVAVSLLPAISSMADNPYESMMLTSMKVDVDIEPESKLKIITDAELESEVVAPGEKVWIKLHLRDDNAKVTKKRIALRLPESIEEGNYPVALVDATNYRGLFYQARSHLLRPETGDELADALQQTLDMPNDHLYFMVRLPEQGLSVSGQELDRLPSSRKALFVTGNNTLTSEYNEWIERRVDMGSMVTGSVGFVIQVRRDGKLSD